MKNFAKTNLAAAAVLAVVLVGVSLAGAQYNEGQSVQLEISPSYISTSVGQDIEFEISLSNPQMMEIYSTATWLKYNPNLLEGVSIIADPVWGSADNLFFDEAAGVVQIDLSSPTALVAPSIGVARVIMHAEKANGFEVEILPYQFPFHVNAMTNVVDVNNQTVNENLMSSPGSRVQVQINSAAGVTDSGTSTTSGRQSRSTITETQMSQSSLYSTSGGRDAQAAPVYNYSNRNLRFR